MLCPWESDRPVSIFGWRERTEGPAHVPVPAGVIGEVGESERCQAFGEGVHRAVVRGRHVGEPLLSPDGLTGVTPDQYEDFFRIHATGPDGETVLMTEVGVDYELQGGTLRVVGLSDLGKAEGDDVHYDHCYFEDSDNYIDIVLEGDEEAARGLTILEIPAGSDDDYLSYYNPAGRGPSRCRACATTSPAPRTSSRSSTPSTTRCGCPTRDRGRCGAALRALDHPSAHADERLQWLLATKEWLRVRTSSGVDLWRG